MKIVDPRTVHVLKNQSPSRSSSESLPGKPGPAPRRCSRVLRAPLHLAATHPHGYRAVASDRPGRALGTLRQALEYVVPGEGKAVVTELRRFLQHREVIGWCCSHDACSQLAGFKVLGARFR